MSRVVLTLTGDRKHVCSSGKSMCQNTDKLVLKYLSMVDMSQRYQDLLSHRGKALNDPCLLNATALGQLY